LSAPKFVIMALVLFGFTLFIASSSYLFAADTNEDRTLEQAAASAMSKGINIWGQVRVDEEVTVNEDVVKEALVRQYVEQSNLSDGEKQLHIYALASQPSMLAVESYNTFDLPIRKYLKEEDEKASVRQFANIIFEKKKLKNLINRSWKM
jgi:hypothetical protein